MALRMRGLAAGEVAAALGLEDRTTGLGVLGESA